MCGIKFVMALVCPNVVPWDGSRNQGFAEQGLVGQWDGRGGCEHNICVSSVIVIARDSAQHVLNVK